jgi:hypothetical protein
MTAPAWRRNINPYAKSPKNVTVELEMGCHLRVRWLVHDEQVTAQGMQVQFARVAPLSGGSLWVRLP